MIETLKEVREALQVMLVQFTKTPSSLKDSEARGVGHKAITKLDALIEATEKAEPVAWEFRMRADWVVDWGLWTPCNKQQHEMYVRVPKLHNWLYETRALYIAPQPAPQQEKAEPVAWIYWDANAGSRGFYKVDPLLPHSDGAFPVFATPQPAPSTSPLTYEEISSLWDGHTVPVFGRKGISPIVFARAIEAAHGIGAKP